MQYGYGKGSFGSPFLILPEIFDGYEYLIEYWQEAGAIGCSGEGVTKLSWQEIEAWLNVKYRNEKFGRVRRNSRRKRCGMQSPWLLADWEIDAVRRMSEEYASEYNQASDKSRPAPYVAEEIEESLAEEIKKVTSQQMKESFRALNEARAANKKT